MYKIIEISGGDGAGKATQARLLCQALTPSKTMSFPNYDSWPGKLIRYMLQEKKYLALDDDAYRLVREPYTFQMLQSMCRIQAKDEILDGLATHHWVMDRYATDGMVYGLLDGCSQAFLDNQASLYPKPDLTICLLGESYRGKGGDVLERDDDYQKRVREYYAELAVRHSRRMIVFRNEDYSHPDTAISIAQIHRCICLDLQYWFGIATRSLEIEQIREGMIGP